jgi:uncharacterized coiled-coil DUF342 family protein
VTSRAHSQNTCVLIGDVSDGTIRPMPDRFDEVIAELRSDRAEMRREFAAWSAHIDRLQAQTDENIRFLRELNRRGERALQELVRSQGAMREEIRANSETTRAHTRTIFAVIDRLEGGSGGLSPAT